MNKPESGRGRHMQVNVVKIGNSKGIRIPKKIPDQCHIDNALELSVKNNEIILTPLRKRVREGWAEAAKHCPGQDDDLLLIPDAFDDDADMPW